MEKQKIIDEVMDFLDFDKIHKVMLLLNWSWARYNQVPETYEIRQFLRELLHEFIDQELNELQCGGFCIRKYNEGIRVSFEIETLEV